MNAVHCKGGILADEMRHQKNRRAATEQSDGELSDESLEFVIGGLERAWVNPVEPLAPSTVGHDLLRPPRSYAPQL